MRSEEEREEELNVLKDAIADCFNDRKAYSLLWEYFDDSGLASELVQGITDSLYDSVDTLLTEAAEEKKMADLEEEEGE